MMMVMMMMKTCLLGTPLRFINRGFSSNRQLRMTGDNFSLIAGALSDRDDRDDRVAEEEAPMSASEMAEERREAERRRREKFNRSQEDREKLRQDIRDKVNETET